MPWNMIMWNMREIVVFPAFWSVAHTIVFHQILLLYACGGYGNPRLWCSPCRMECDALWYMEWNFWPQFDQKRCQHMLENPTCRTGNAYQAASYSRGGILLNVSVFSGNMVPFGFEEEQRNPDLAQFADTEAEPPAKRVKKISWTAYPMVLRDPIEKLMIDERNTRLHVYSRNHCLRNCELKGS